MGMSSRDRIKWQEEQYHKRTRKINRFVYTVLAAIVAGLSILGAYIVSLFSNGGF